MAVDAQTKRSAAFHVVKKDFHDFSMRKSTNEYYLPDVDMWGGLEVTIAGDNMFES